MTTILDDSGRCYRFGPFRLDGQRRILFRNESALPLTPIVLDVLLHLVEQRDRVVTKQELLDAVWPDRVVEESNVKQTVFSLRKALGTDGERMIATVPGRGYRFTEPVETGARAVVAMPEPGLVPALMPVRAAPRRRWLVPAGAVLAALVVAGLVAVWLWPTAQGIRTLVLAEFDNQSGEPVFDRALASLLRADLGQTPFLNVLTDRQIEQTLALMTKPADTRVTPSLAFEVCTRTGGDAVVSGAIATLGSRYLITLAATGCRDGASLSVDKEEAGGRDAVPLAVDRLIDRMRRRLGESAGSIARFDVPLLPAKTASLDALKAYSEAKYLLDHGQLDDAATLSRRALALDPDFVAAYVVLAVAETNQGLQKEAMAALSEAYARRDRVNEHEKRKIEGLYHQIVTRDSDAAIHAFRMWTAIYPLDISGWGNLANAEAYLGHYPAAADAARAAIRLRSNVEATYYVLALSELGAGHPEAALAALAEAEAKGLAGANTHLERLRVAISTGDAAGIARERDWAAANPPALTVLFAEAGWTFAHGRIGAGEAIHARMADAFMKAGVDDFARTNFARTLAVLGLADRARALLERTDETIDQTSDDYLVALAEIGATDEARRKLDAEVAARPTDTLLNKLFAPEVRAVLALKAGRPAEAIAALEPAVPFQSRGLGVPYYLGQASLAGGDGHEAAAQFRTVLDHPGWDPESPYHPLAWLGLARALKLDHDLEGSQAAYRAFLADWADADPDVPVGVAAKAEFADMASAR